VGPVDHPERAANLLPKTNRNLLDELRAPRLASGALSKAEHQVDIMLGLIHMRRAGLLRSIHTHPLRIELSTEPGQLRPIDWRLAERMVSRYRLDEPKKQDYAPEPNHATLFNNLR
jgi:hypothetical protein